MKNERELTPEEQREAMLASYWNFRFKSSMVTKAPYTKRWKEYFDAYNGDYFKNTSLPDYKSNMVANYIFSIIETIRPIMLDHDPKFQAIPRQPEGMPFSNDLQEALSYEWDREKMSVKLYRELITMLITGTAIFFIPWDAQDKNIRGIPVNPFNLFPDPLATTVEDAEYLIYASYKNVEVLKRAFPNHADRLAGGSIKYSELVRDNDKDAHINNQVLTLEIYTKDYEREESLQNNVKVSKLKYPKGRVLTICPDLGLVLSDKEMPYQDGEHPFRLIKDYDLPGKFWGEGEVSQLLSPQKHMNELNNAIIDNAKTTANMPWIIDKNSGIGQGALTSRPGLVVRKNPGSEVRREQPPSMPAYVVNAVETYKHDMEQVSGIFDSLKGNSETGVYTAQGILALQEAGQARIRLKVKIMEQALGDIAKLWVSRMRQFWKQDKWLSITRHDGTYDMKKFTTNSLNYDFDIRITAGSTMPVNRGAMLDLMIRLAQTPMPDGQNLVDREAVVHYLPDEIKSALIRRMQNGQAQLEQMKQAVDQLTQQLQQVVQETQQNDEQTFGVIDDIASTLEQLNKKILQMQQSNARIEEEKRKTEEIARLKDESYNAGYADAEKLMQGENGMMSSVDESGNVGGAEMPEDILQGIESMSDDELQMLIAQHPDLVDLIK